MSCRVGLVWGTKQHFNRYIEDCGIICDLVTPHMLAAPFFRAEYNCIIIPTGFANPAYSNLLPALRASSSRIQKFVERGGNLLVFGAATDKPGSYDWVPFPVTYQHECRPVSVQCSSQSEAGMIIEDYNSSCIECDGTFVDHGGESVGQTGIADVIIEKQIGSGKIVVTTVHEYPSRKFLKTFCETGLLTKV